MHYKKGTGYVEVSGRKVCSLREMELIEARIHGHNGDVAAFTRLRIERKAASDKALLDAYTGREKAPPIADALDIFSGKIIRLV